MINLDKCHLVFDVSYITEFEPVHGVSLCSGPRGFTTENDLYTPDFFYMNGLLFLKKIVLQNVTVNL